MSKPLLCLLLVVIAVSGINSPPRAAASEPAYGRTLRWHEVANPPKLDPHMNTDTVSGRVALCMFDSLVANSPQDGAVEPWLAESWRVEDDGRVWTFKLRPGVRFHAVTEGGKPTANGGREVTAEDWKWSFERLVRDKGPHAYFLDHVVGYADLAEGRSAAWAGIEALDKHTLRFTLDEPFAPFLAMLAYPSLVVLPREDVEKLGREFTFHPVGTGAFVFHEWRQDQRLTLKKNPDYWRRDHAGRQLPYLDAWELVVVPDTTVAWEEFKIGNLDMMHNVPALLVPEARNILGPNLLEGPVPGTYFYGINCDAEPFKDNIPLRQALNHAVNRELMNEILLEGLYYPAKGVLPPSMPGYDPELKGYDFDPDKARRLLAEAGYPDGRLSLTLQVNQDTLHQALAEAVQAQLAEVGVKLNIRVVDWGVHLDNIDKGDSQIFRLGWIADYLDPDNFLYVNFHSNNIGAKGNQAFYRNPEADDLLLRARSETDTAKRMELYHRAERIIVDDAPWLFLFHYHDNLAVRPGVEGAVMPALGAYSVRMDEVWIER